MNKNLVLIAEDDRDVRDLIAHALEAAGYQSVGARDGQSAVRLLALARPGALITDVRLPGINGMELCRLARRAPITRDTAIIMISANAHDHDIAAGLRAGADRYLPKPITLRQILTELHDVVALKVPRAIAARAAR